MYNKQNAMYVENGNSKVFRVKRRTKVFKECGLCKNIAGEGGMEENIRAKETQDWL